MEDFFILNSGYQLAIKNSLEILSDLPDIDIIKDRLDRLGDKYRIIHDDSKYIGKISKYYDKTTDLGYIIIDDIYKLQGVMLFVSDKLYKSINEKELIFIKKTMKPFMSKEFNNEKELTNEFNSLIKTFKESSE